MKLPDIVKKMEVMDLVRRALKEDVGAGDATTLALVPARSVSRAMILSRGSYVVSGTGVARLVFQSVDPAVKCEILLKDGVTVKPGQAIMRLTGPTRGILTAERTALNFMQRMTGIATLVRQFVKKVGGYKAAIMDTRKTTPLLRMLEKYAVLCGGGQNHRMGLHDMILIKDNHRALHGGNLDGAVQMARRRYPRLPIEVEVESESEFENALKGKPDWVLLDNMDIGLLRRCVRLNRERAKLEASGGINLGNVAGIAATGVDAISIGALTHSAPAADLSLEIC